MIEPLIFIVMNIVSAVAFDTAIPDNAFFSFFFSVPFFGYKWAPFATKKNSMNHLDNVFVRKRFCVHASARHLRF